MIRFRTLILILLLCITASAEDFVMNYRASIEANYGSSQMAPYYISALRNGTLNSGKGSTLNIAAYKPLDKTKRFSYSFGVEGYAQISNDVTYMRFNYKDNAWYERAISSPRIWLHQLWGEIKYRCLYLWVGMRDFTPALVNRRLSSGDLIESGNSRNIPGLRAGFHDFQNIPFTNGWVQIQGEIGFAKSLDNNWQKEHYNYYNEHINLGWWYNYKRCFFRTKPSMDFSVTVGMQAAAQFAGKTVWYRNGEPYRTYDMELKPIDFLDMIILRQGDAYWKGNHVGSWDFQARYKFSNNDELKAYFQWLWEDGSGIGKLNGMDGLWGIEWAPAKKGVISGAVIEFMTYMNQSGPVHFAPNDRPNTDMTEHHADGRDNYYNNHWYNGYALYGMSIGSPMFISPIYNTNGATTTFTQNRFWGVHGALEGEVINSLSYRAMVSYRQFYGTLHVPSLKVTHDVSAFAEVKWAIQNVPGLTLKGQLSFDLGDSLYGNNFGGLISLCYSGMFNFNKGKFIPCVI